MQFTTMELYNVPVFLSDNPQLILPFVGAAAIAIIPKYFSSIFSSKSSESASSAIADNNNMSGSLLRMFRRNKKDESTTQNSKKSNPEKYDENELSSTSSSTPLGLQQASTLSVMMSSRENQERNPTERKQDQVSGSIVAAGGGGAALAGASGERSNSAGSSSAADDTKISEMIDSKVGTINEEISKTKGEFASLKEEMGSLKAEIQNITSAFESSLVELKAFQAEMVNPMNFMRQYFDTLEIKQLSDPVKTLRPPEITTTPATAASATTLNPTPDSNPAPIQRPPPSLERVEEKNHFVPKKSLPEREQRSVEGDPEPASSPTLDNELGQRKKDISSLLIGGMSPSKMMSIVEIVDEILAAMGPEGVNMLVEQYKHLGLKKEDELVIYNVMKMLNESKMMTDDVIAMFYRFGQVLGINDKEAELHYMRLIANKKQRRPISKPEVRRE